jgi:Cu+-exporting ATPase
MAHEHHHADESSGAARDPVCGMRVDRWVATSSARYGDKEFVFCSERCREKFLTEPNKYLPAT